MTLHGTPRRVLLMALAAACFLSVAPLPAQDARQQVDALFAEWDVPGSPGCALGVVSNGALTHARGYGVANLEQDIPITPGTVFYMASVSKQFVAASLGLLVLDGRIALDDDVRQLVPELPAYDTPITIEQLLHHVSGLRDYLELMGMAELSLEEAYASDQILELVARQEGLNFPPGDRYLYSNTGYFLIPIIIERVTGQSIREYAAERLFGPLGMHDTNFHDDWRHAIPDRALSYRSSDDGFELSFLEKFDQVGSGGLLSTVEDLARWDANFHEPAVGGQALLDLLRTRGVLADGDTISYAGGLRLGEYNGLAVEQHSGSMMGFRTHVVRFPAERFSVICLCNFGDINPGALARDVAELYLAERFTARLAEYAGNYYSRELDVTRTLTVVAGRLMLERTDEPPLELSSGERDRFHLGGSGQISFLRDDSGRITGLVLDGSRARGIAFTRR
jgi:CubicO group peptidase (beta-lactamase class C family)